VRLKFRRDRRHGMPRVNPLIFYPRFAAGTLLKMWRYWKVYRTCKAILDDVMAAPDRWTYTDLAITPPQSDEFAALDMYHTRGGEDAVARKHRDEAIRSGTFAVPAAAAE
jgi:hypothetical protein